MTVPPTAETYSHGTPARRLIPGAREPRAVLTPLAEPHAHINLPDGNLLDAATTADRSREGGGAPNQRRKPGESTAWERFMSRAFGR